MGQVTVSVNARSYLVACDDGQEEHLRSLAGYIDRHVSDLAQSVGQAGDTRLMLMAGLMVADELVEALDRVQKLEEELSDLKDGSELENTLADFLDKAAGRIDQLALQLEAS